jgi:alpha-L-fucosidase
VLWNDITYPTDPLPLFADYYNAIPDGVVNDRFTLVAGTTHHDYSTSEFTVLADVSPGKFETVRGMGHGFGYNQNETDADYTSSDDLIRLLVDVVSKNGNLLLNVGPMADGTVPASQVTRLHAIGDWLRTNGEAVYGTKPWTRAAGTTADGMPLRFTASRDDATVYAAVMGPLPAGSVTLIGIGDAPGSVRLLGVAGKLHWTMSGEDLVITLPAGAPAAPASVFALRQRR